MVGCQGTSAQGGGVVVVQFLHGRRLVSQGIGGPQAEVALVVEHRNFGTEVEARFLVYRAACTGREDYIVGCRPLLLGVCGQCVD